MDTTNQSKTHYLQYELPIQLMMNDKIRSKVVQPRHTDDNFKAKGLTFTVESTHETPEPLIFDIQRIDAIYNPEFEAIMRVYTHPVFFKSVPAGLTFQDQGFIDNGRKIVNIEESVIQQQASTSKASINDFAYKP